MRRPVIVFLLLAVVALLPCIHALVSNEIFTLRDHFDYFAPLRFHTARALSAGELPLWNEYNASGEAWLSNPQTAVFYPPAWIFLLLPFSRAYLIFLSLHLLLLGAGSYLLFRRRAGPPAALFGAITLMLAGPTLSLLDVNNNLTAFAWVPLILLAAVRLRERTLEPETSACLLALAFLAGEPVLFGCSVALFLLVAGRGVWLRAAYAVVLALLLSAAQLFPFLEWVMGSDRSQGLGAETAFRESLAPLDWLSLGVSMFSRSTDFAFLLTSQKFILSLYLGGTVLLFLLLSLSFFANAVQRRLVAPWWGLLVVSLAFSAGNRIPFAEPLLLALKFDVNRYPARLAPFAALSLIALAVLAFDRVDSFDHRSRRNAAAGAILIAVFSLLAFQPLKSPSTPLRLAFTLLSVMVPAALLLFRPEVFRRRIGFAALCGFVVIDLLASSQFLLRSRPFVPTVEPYGQLFRGDRKVFRKMSDEKPGVARTGFSRRSWLSGYLNLYDRLFDVSTASPVMTSSYERLHNAFMETPRADLLDFLSVKYLLTDRELRSPSLEKRGRIGKVNLYFNASAFPLAVLSVHAVDAPVQLARTLVLSGQNDVRTQTLVDRADVAAALRASASALPNPAHVAIRKLEGAETVIDVRTARPILLTIPQVDDRGWKLWIDHQPAQKVLVNGFFRGALVPAGTHRITWRYRPVTLATGIVISMLALLFVALRSVISRSHSGDSLRGDLST